MRDILAGTDLGVYKHELLVIKHCTPCVFIMYILLYSELMLCCYCQKRMSSETCPGCGLDHQVMHPRVSRSLRNRTREWTLAFFTVHKRQKKLRVVYYPRNPQRNQSHSLSLPFSSLSLSAPHPSVSLLTLPLCSLPSPPATQYQYHRYHQPRQGNEQPLLCIPNPRGGHAIRPNTACPRRPSLHTKRGASQPAASGNHVGKGGCEGRPPALRQC